jgi:F0F1-type ATP synthase assembly protein I
VQEVVPSPLRAWESYYVIVGSSAAALTGLMFVVITLVVESRRRSGGALDAFATPTIVHFCIALLVAAVISSPWHSLTPVSLVIGLIGLATSVYVGIVTRRARRQKDYKPVLEDWIWHVSLPIAAYATYIIAASTMARHPEAALFGVGAATLLLVFIGIHNAWDTVTYLALENTEQGSAG